MLAFSSPDFNFDDVSVELARRGHTWHIFNVFQPAKKYQDVIASRYYEMRKCARQVLGIYTSGNRIGHDPDNPTFPIMTNPFTVKDWDSDNDLDELGSARRSHFIYEAMDATRKVFAYPRMMEKLSFHDDGRLKRSEGREGALKLLQVLIYYMAPSMQVGFVPTSAEKAHSAGFSYYDNKFIAGKAGLSDSQLKQAVKWLLKRGYIKRKKRFNRNADGTYKGVCSTTILNGDKIFQELGIMGKWKRYYNWAYEEVKKKAKAIGVKIGVMFSTKVFNFVELLDQDDSDSKKPKPGDYPVDDRRYYTCQLKRHEFAAFESALLDAAFNKDWTPQQKYSAALAAAKKNQ